MVAQLPPDSIRLVRAVAHDIAKRIPHADLDDLVSAGTVGLMRAAERFDESRGLAFSTYAVPLIRGAILDELRSRAWSTRGARAKARRITTAAAELAGTLGRPATAREVAEHLGLDLPTYWEWERSAETCLVVRFGGSGAYDASRAPLEDVIADDHAHDPVDALEWEETVSELQEAVALLPARQQRVITLYYQEQRTLREIGEVLGVTEGRISQLRSAALRSLRATLVTGGAPAGPPDGDARRERSRVRRARHVETAARELEQGA